MSFSIIGETIIDEVEVEEKYTCGICFGLLFNPCRPNVCKHVFCEDCLIKEFDRSATCAMCKRGFDLGKIVYEDRLDREIVDSAIICDICNQIVKLVNLQGHRMKCNDNLSAKARNQSKMTNSLKNLSITSYSLPSQNNNNNNINKSKKSNQKNNSQPQKPLPNNNTSQGSNKSAGSNLNIKTSSVNKNNPPLKLNKITNNITNNNNNHQTQNKNTVVPDFIDQSMFNSTSTSSIKETSGKFKCPYCNKDNMTLDNLRGHCNEFHVNAEKEVVCPVCASMEWGDPNQKSIDFITHLNWRHKFSYNKYVDLKLDEDDALSKALNESLRVY